MVRKKKKVAEVKWIYRYFFGASIFALVSGFFIYLFCIHDLPDINNLDSKGRRASMIFEAYDGQPIATYGDLFRKVVNVKDLPKYVGNAIVAIEDKRFYNHCGVDFLGIIRAIYANIARRRIVQGGSTITQQLAKNLFLSADKSIKRKVQEFTLALWLEYKFTKRQILSIYLNRVYFGSCAYGIDAAAYRYFGKEARQLTIYEAAKLAGTLRAPSTYSPFYNPEKSDARAEVVLACMQDEGYISGSEMKEALIQKDKLTKRSAPMDENKYFTDWAVEQIQELINTDEEDIVVRTTLDSRLQQNAALVIKNVLQEYGFRNRANQMALVALDKTGAVRAMIGGYSYGASQFNRVMAIRSSGSAFKYFVYLTAMEQGMGIYDLIGDGPLNIGGWQPKNHKHISVGEIPLLDAFSKSVNTSAVRLARKVGMDKIIAKAEQLGITTELKNNIAAALGAGGVTLIDITACFGAAMLNGHKMTPFGIVSIRTPAGKYLYKARATASPMVISPGACEKIKILLRDVVEKGTGRQSRIPLVAYGKTGTSNDSRDASFIGFSSHLVTGVWIGNDDNSPMGQKMYGGFLPAIAWRKFMLSALNCKKTGDEKPEAVDDSDSDGSSGVNRRPKPSAKSKTRLKTRLKDFVLPLASSR
ncbi:MAG: PBP1A family penicillin-binding protein [Holosporaceae bacterium]|jgi:penicillin-binding protein 1A|nr:PBP1A family penicillin-binding protein [Holosporaceae bacterium]